eukprot:184311_1
MQHLNCTVSLLTLLQIRFEGIITAISPEQCCIQLDNMTFKGLEDRDPPESLESTKDPTDVKSLRFFQNDIITIKLLNSKDTSTQTDITTDIINLFVNKDDKKQNDVDINNSNYLFCVGLIADPQYADAPSRFNYSKTRIRRYKNALTITKNAIKTWNKSDNPSLIICLGDIIDGLNKKAKQSEKCMKDILSVFNQFKPANSKQLIQNIIQHPLNQHCNIEQKNNNHEWIPKFPFFQNLIGNHELYNFNQQELMQYLYSPDTKQRWNCLNCGLANAAAQKQCQACFVDNNIMSPRFYYSFSPFPGYIFIILNCYELSVIGYNYYNEYDETFKGMDSSHYNLKQYAKLYDIQSLEHKYKMMHPNKQIAMEMLCKANNGNTNIFPYTLDDKKRWCHFNGAFGSTQLEWFEKQLIEIEKLKIKHNVILFGHIPIWCVFSDEKKGLQGNERTLCWDYKEINNIIDKYKCVKMYIAGHKHGGQCVKGINGIWHKTFEGAIEASLNTDCFGTMYFYHDKAVLKGYGIQSRVFPYR